MPKKDKIKINEESCGCLLDDLLKDKPVKDENSLCSVRESDMEFFIDPDTEKVSHDFYMRRLTDGLPIIPPTRERVNRFLNNSSRGKNDVVAVLPPKLGLATPEKIAINSVMAGCLPQFQPVIEHSLKALSQDKFNLAGVNATTHPVAICTILNGPLSRELGINSSLGCLGPGNMANATIGRAIRLCLINIAGAVPGVGDHATHGSPAKYSYCFSENENESPWDPLHVERGYIRDGSAVTVMAAESPQNVNDHRSTSAEDLLDTVAHTAATAGCNNSHVPGELLVIMSPEHAQTVARDGWDKKDVKNYLHQKMTVPVVLSDRGGRGLDRKWIIDDEVPITRSPSDVVLVVAGGPGRHTVLCHGFGTGSESVTLPLPLEDGTVVKSGKNSKNNS